MTVPGRAYWILPLVTYPPQDTIQDPSVGVQVNEQSSFTLPV